jgi:hypothetical protein
MISKNARYSAHISPPEAPYIRQRAA